MKIGIVTQPLKNNYGGLLQNYALQQVLKKLGHEAKTIHFVYRLSFGRYILHLCKQLLRAVLKGKRPRLRTYAQYAGGGLKPQMVDFVARHIDTTKPVRFYTPDTVREEAFDAVITGSDQVWRPAYNLHLEDMYLKFVPDSVLKVAYAASFGVDHWEYKPWQTSRCAKQIQRLSAVSVREQTGIDLCRKHFQVEAQCVLDPTLLAGAEAYTSLLQPHNGQKYLLAYILDITPKKERFVRDQARELRLEARICSTDGSASLSVEEWLSQIAHAEMVITDSFHGTVFSLLFHREFLSIVNKERGGTRFLSLLQPLGLGNRLTDLTGGSKVHREEIDWAAIEARLDQQRQLSMNFLTQALHHA